MLQALTKSKLFYVVLGLYTITLLWWLKINFLSTSFDDEVYYFNWFYGLIALTGSLYTIFYVSKVWGGYKSIIGKGLIFISLGLLSQWLGLQIWTYYNLILKVEVPYPSLADIGYFALIPFYTLGAWMIARAAAGKVSLRSLDGKIFALLIPVVMLFVAYTLFLKDLGIDPADPVKTFLDFGYPLGEIIPVSIAIYTLLVSKKFYGGRMKSRIYYLIFAFSFQFITEYAFLYSASAGVYQNGNINDLLYATSYAIMAIGLISFNRFE